MCPSTKMAEYVKEGNKIRLEIGDFEPSQGDYLIHGGNVSKIVFVTHKRTAEGSFFFVETEDEPGLLMEVKKGMKIGRVARI